jgi:AcrR family transcriptional regulator
MRLDHSAAKMGRPQVRSDVDTLKIIHASARAEFLAGGYASTSMEKVACRAGVSTKTLYRLVPTKDALFAGMMVSYLDNLVSRIHAGEFEGVIASELERLLIDCASFTLENEVIGLIRLVSAESDRFPKIAEAFHEKGIVRVRIAVAAWLTAQQKKGLIEIDDPRMAAGLLLGMMISEPQRAAILRQGRPLSKKEIAKRAKACAKLFLDGCRAGKRRGK